MKRKVITHFISDTHFFHKNIIGYANRPFEPTPEGIQQMNQTIINNWNACVKKEDTLMHLGDVALNCSKAELKELLSKLNGHKYLILGNHDMRETEQWWRDVGFEEVFSFPIIYKKWYILSHEPLFLNEKIPYINIHGHIHQHTMSGPYINASVEQTNFYPLSWKDIERKVKEGFYDAKGINFRQFEV